MHYHSSSLGNFRIVSAFHTVPSVIIWHTRSAACDERTHEAAAQRLPLSHSFGDQLPVKKVPSSFLRLCTIATSSPASWRSSLRYAGNHCLVTLFFFFDSLVASACAVAPCHNTQRISDNGKQGGGSVSSHRFPAQWLSAAGDRAGGDRSSRQCRVQTDAHRLAGGGLVLNLLLHRQEKRLRVLLPAAVRHEY
jgi:hypothetical protein